ncbi:HAD-IA family hydrolase [Phyllobacterium leguminum]|uniref:Phosphoglycolate phosphatase n=1 Tax=Phyllobacterium leguminum TaxID=314237 RepID=A0A318SZT6_9HYPH|nr:HAD-IA family hydrolase [Phyllobacterium leguminum]PYE86812.1 phosphoglycolate phosphatase [Phyllobacterium leguminum]
MRLVLFDCDGTLVDSAGVIHRCMARTFAEAGIAELDEAATRSVIGLSLDHAIARLLKCDIDASVLALAQRYKDHFVAMRGEPDFAEPAFPGVPELIAELARRDDIVIGMVTGKSRRGVRKVLEMHGLTEHFMVVRTADDCPSKPHPAMVLESCVEAGFNPSAALVIGDAIYDMEMARAAGALAVGVSWGYHTPEALRATGAHHVLDVPADLLAVLENQQRLLDA